MQHTNMVHNVVARLQEVLHQEQVTTENQTTVPEPVDHVSNAVQSTQKYLDTQLKQTQEMMQAMQMQYYVVPK